MYIFFLEIIPIVQPGVAEDDVEVFEGKYYYLARLFFFFFYYYDRY